MKTLGDSPTGLDVAAHLSPVMAISEHGLALLTDSMRRLAAGQLTSGPPGRPGPTLSGAIRIPIFGPISYRPTLLGMILGWTSTTEIRSALDEALRDSRVQTIILDIDSPGGSVFGIQELAEEIYRGRGKKRIVAHAAPVAASAAFWLGAAASEFYAIPSAQVGSVGVVAVHFDLSRALDMEGIKPTIIATAPYKGEGTQLEPLSGEGRAHIQGEANKYHETFVAALARYRGVSPATVASSFGQGRVVTAPEAVARGMLDGLAVSLGEVLNIRARPQMPRSLRAAQAEAAINIARARAL